MTGITKQPAATGVRTRVEGAIGWITLDGADRLNAMGSPTYAALGDAIQQLERNPAVRAVVVHGSGRAFSAGADIDEISRFGSRSDFEAFVHGFTDALAVVSTSPLPVIAAIHGAALGGGLEVAMACDFRIATASAKLGLPEAKLGVLPGAGGTQRLPRLIPAAIAMEMLMLGTPISGERGHALGLVNHLSEEATLLEDARQFALALARGAGQLPAATKALLRDTRLMSVEVGIVEERRVASDLFASKDGREGFAAFVARRPPAFEGVSADES